jgi:hypothetical protein
LPWTERRAATSASVSALPSYAACIENTGNEVSLERNKIYVVLPDVAGSGHGTQLVALI